MCLMNDSMNSDRFLAISWAVFVCIDFFNLSSFVWKWSSVHSLSFSYLLDLQNGSAGL